MITIFASTWLIKESKACPESNYQNTIVHSTEEKQKIHVGIDQKFFPVSWLTPRMWAKKLRQLKGEVIFLCRNYVFKDLRESYGTM